MPTTQKYCDSYVSTLSASYTAGGVSLTVTNPGSGDTTLPATGVYYVIVEAETGNTLEVFRVTARSGSTLTVVGAQAGSSASNHASGAVIRGVILTAEAMRGHRIDTVRHLTRADQLALSGDERFGTVYLTDQPYLAAWTGTEWLYYPHGGAESSPFVAITTTSLPGGVPVASYSETLTATDGDTPYTWSVISGALPSGLSLNSSTGAITGTLPATSGVSDFTVEVEAANGTTDTQALSIFVDAGDVDTWEDMPGAWSIYTAAWSVYG